MGDMRQMEELLAYYVEQLDEDRVLELAEKALRDGMEPPALLKVIIQGMSRVGKLYESKEYYIADLIMAGLIFKGVLELDEMTGHFHNPSDKKIGRVVIGTVKGDIHDIGKDIFIGLIETNGFEVIDLGVDVPKEQFVKKAIEYKPHIVGLSGILTGTIEAMKETVNAFTEAGIRDEVKIILGGDHLTKEACEYIGADNFTKDASVGVKICRDWIGSTNKKGAAKNG